MPNLMGMGSKAGTVRTAIISFTGITNTNPSTITAHSHIPITNASTYNATVSGSPKPAAPHVSRKRRLEEEEADNDRHRTQHRKFTHLHEPASDGVSSGYESSPQGCYYRNRIIQPIHGGSSSRLAAGRLSSHGQWRTPPYQPASKQVGQYEQVDE